jgi:hypothetical protein
MRLRSPARLKQRRLALVVLAATGVIGPCVSAAAAADADSASLSVEVNKLEPQDKSCQLYLVINNTSAIAYPTLKLDLIFFGADGVIARRLAVDLGPVRPNKKSVKSFDLENLACGTVGSILLNDVLDCRSEAGPLPDCLGRVTVSSRAGIPVSK